MWRWWINHPHLPAYVVYDLQQSRAESLNDYKCAPEIRASCDQQILAGEEGFRYALIQALGEIPKCRGVSVIVDAGGSPDPTPLEPARKRGYWRLTVDYHIGRDAQSFKLEATNPNWPGMEGEAEARGLMESACEAARHNGYWNYW